MKVDHSVVVALAPATPEKCENKFFTMMVDLKRVIANWERSGQVDGGVDVDEDGISDGRFVVWKIEIVALWIVATVC